MKREKVLEFKRNLWGVPLRFTTVTGDILLGYLANKKVEKRVLLDSGIPLNCDDYFCLVNPHTKKASFVLASDVENIDLIR